MGRGALLAAGTSPVGVGPRELVGDQDGVPEAANLVGQVGVVALGPFQTGGKAGEKVGGEAVKHGGQPRVALVGRCEIDRLIGSRDAHVLNTPAREGVSPSKVRRRRKARR